MLRESSMKVQKEGFGKAAGFVDKWRFGKNAPGEGMEVSPYITLCISLTYDSCPL